MSMSTEEKIRHYQRSIDKSIALGDNSRLMHCIQVLSKLPVTVAHLELTGIGRTVNSLRKIEDGVGESAKELVNKWKVMVANNDTSEEEDEACVPDAPDSYESPEYDSEPEKPRKLGTSSFHSIQPQALRVPLPQSPPDMIIDTEDLQRSLEQSSDHSVNNAEEEDNESASHHVVKSRDKQRASAHSSKKLSSKDTKSKYDSPEKSSGKSKNSSAKDKGEFSNTSKEKKKLDEGKSAISSGQDKIRPSDKKRKQESSSRPEESSKKRKDRDEDERGSENEEVEEEVDEHEPEDIVEEEREEGKYEEAKSDVESSQEYENGSDETKSKSTFDSNSKSKTKHRDGNEKLKRDEKHRSSTSDERGKSEKRKSEKHHSKESHSKSSKSHSSSSSKDRSHSKDESKPSKGKSSESDKVPKDEKEDRSHSKDENKHSKGKTSESDKVPKEEKDESPKDEIKPKDCKEHREKKKHREHSGEKKPKSKKSKNRADGIDCDSGTSFADALGMCVMPPPSKKKKDNSSSSSQKSNKSEQPNTSRSSNQSTPSSSKLSTVKVKDEVIDNTESLHLLSPSMKLEPLDRIEDEVDLASTLPEPSLHYKPLPHISHAQRKIDEDIVLSQVLHSKNPRTKVYSGNKSGWSTVPSLSEMCIQILIENIDALEYTGGVPYYILKPVLERATPDQLIELERFNPYLIEESDSLWQFHCNKDFRTKQREEMESWREMYIRCYEEREAKLKALTNNIKQSIDKSVPVRSTKLAYVDNVVKPPRNVLRKQAKYGTANHTAPSDAKKKLIAAASGLGVSNSSSLPTERISVPPPLAGRMRQSSSMVKKAKAPLMAKALQAIKGRYKR